MVPVFLAFQGAAGDVLHVQLPQAEPCGSCFLPDRCTDDIDLATFRNTKTHSVVRIRKCRRLKCGIRLIDIYRSLSKVSTSQCLGWSTRTGVYIDTKWRSS